MPQQRPGYSLSTAECGGSRCPHMRDVDEETAGGVRVCSCGA